MTLPEALQDRMPKQVDRWRSEMKGSDDAAGGTDDRTMEQSFKDILALPNKLATQRAVVGLLTVLGRKACKQWELILSRVTDAPALEKALAKLWAKKSPTEQGEMEVEMRDWLEQIRSSHGVGGVTECRDAVLARLEKVMVKFVAMCKGDGKPLDWSALAFEGTIELPFKEDEEYQEVMDILAEVQDSSLPAGSGEQEALLRKSFTKAVHKASTAKRRAEIAEAFEEVVGEAPDNKKALSAFLNNRVGENVGTVVLASGHVKVAAQDERTVLGFTFATVPGVTLEAVNAFASKLLESPCKVTKQHLELNRGYARAGASLKAKVLGSRTDRSFVSEDGQIEVRITSVQEGTALPYFLEAGSWTNIQGTGSEGLKRAAWTAPEDGGAAKKPKHNKQGGKGNKGGQGGTPLGYQSQGRPVDHGTVPYQGDWSQVQANLRALPFHPLNPSFKGGKGKGYKGGKGGY